MSYTFCSITLVILQRTPFKVIDVVVLAIFVFVVHLWQPFWIWYKCFCHESVYQYLPRLSFKAHYYPIISSVELRPKYSWFAHDVAIWLDVSYALFWTHSPKIRDFIETSVTIYLLPYFALKRFNGKPSFWINFYHFLDVVAWCWLKNEERPPRKPLSAGDQSYLSSPSMFYFFAFQESQFDLPCQFLLSV